MGNYEISREGSTVLCNGEPIADSSGFPKRVMRKVRRLERKTRRSRRKCHADLREKHVRVPAIRRM